MAEIFLTWCWATITHSHVIYQGWIQDFKLGGVHLKILRRAEGGAKFVGVFRVKNNDFTQKNHIFSNFRGGGRIGCTPPWIRPCIYNRVTSLVKHNPVYITEWPLLRKIIFRNVNLLDKCLNYIMVSMFVSNTIPGRSGVQFPVRSDQRLWKWSFRLFCFSAYHTALSSKEQRMVGKESKTMCPSGKTCLSGLLFQWDGTIKI